MHYGARWASISSCDLQRHVCALVEHQTFGTYSPDCRLHRAVAVYLSISAVLALERIDPARTPMGCTRPTWAGWCWAPARRYRCARALCLARRASIAGACEWYLVVV